MTDCNDTAHAPPRDDKPRDDEPILFSSLGRRRVVADFGGGDITGDGGALLLREVDRHLGLIEQSRRAPCRTRGTRRG